MSEGEDEEGSIADKVRSTCGKEQDYSDVEGARPHLIVLVLPLIIALPCLGLGVGDGVVCLCISVMVRKDPRYVSAGLPLLRWTCAYNVCSGGRLTTTI